MPRKSRREEQAGERKMQRHDPLHVQMARDRDLTVEAEEAAQQQAAGDKSGKAGARKAGSGAQFLDAPTSRRIMRAVREQQRELDEDEAGPRVVRTSRAAEQETTGGIGYGSDGDNIDDGDDFDDQETYEREAGRLDIDPEDEHLLDTLLGDAAPRRTLADMIFAKLAQQQGGGEAEMTREEAEAKLLPQMDPKVVQVYEKVGELMRRYSTGRLPKAFKIIPALSNWEDVLWLTDPSKWSPGAMFAATRLFSSNLNPKMAQRFYNLVLYPRVMEDIAENKRLNFWHYLALKKAMYKPAAWFKGILLPMCDPGACTLRQALIVSSVLARVSIPVLHSSVALMKIAQMEYSNINAVFIRTLLEKKYSLPYSVLAAVVGYFVRFMSDDRELPLIWHKGLLSLAQRYKADLTPEQKDALKVLMRKHFHYGVTPEIRRELFGVQRDEEAPLPVWL